MTETALAPALKNLHPPADLNHRSQMPKVITVLSVSGADDDHGALEGVINPGMNLRRASSAATALAALRREAIPIVVCERDLDEGTWQDLLEAATSLPHPPMFIVTSRIADDHLWAEALNLGAYDVLAKPFHPPEIVRTLDSAWRRWSN